MFLRLFNNLRNIGIPVSLKEYLVLLEGIDKGLCKNNNVDDFYTFSRLCLVKDEKYFDKFDKAFKNFYEVNNALIEIPKNLPENWLVDELKKIFTEEMKRGIKNIKEWEEILEAFKQKLKEQKKKHKGGNKWIGTGGSSMYGNSGYNPKGIRIGGESRNRTAVKVWDKRVYKDLDEQATVSSRNLKVALRRLRKFVREGKDDEFDLDNTIHSTAKNSGLLDVKYRPEKTNKVRVLLLIDIGGSMDEHAESSEQLFSAAKSEFKSLDYFYFHNCIYERLWKLNYRRENSYIITEEILRKYNSKTKVIVVGDALMSPYEITYPGGSVEHWNEYPGSVWLEKLKKHFEKIIWLNPEDKTNWKYSQSTNIIKKIFCDKMYQLNLKDIEYAIKELAK